MFWRKTKQDKGTENYVGVGNTGLNHMRKQHLSIVNELASNHVILASEIKGILIKKKKRKTLIRLFYKIEWKWRLLSVCLFATPWTIYSPWNSPGQNSGAGSCSLSRTSSQPRDQTQVSCIAGRFFTSWASREAFIKYNSIYLYSTYWKNYILCCTTFLKIFFKNFSFHLSTFSYFMIFFP